MQLDGRPLSAVRWETPRCSEMGGLSMELDGRALSTVRRETSLCSKMGGLSGNVIRNLTQVLSTN